MVVKKYLASGVPFSNNEANGVFTALVQLYFTLSSHPLFSVLERGDGQSHLLSSGSGHLPLLYKVSFVVVEVLGRFVLSGEWWSTVVLSFICSKAFELTR